MIGHAMLYRVRQQLGLKVWSTVTEHIAYSETIGNVEKCPCKQQAANCVTSTDHSLLRERSIGNLGKCHCKQWASYCVTVTDRVCCFVEVPQTDGPYFSCCAARQ